MQFIDLKTQYAQIKEQVQENINNVLEHGQFIMGPEVKQLEAELAETANAKHVLAVGSGTAALHVALLALDIGPGDEVITTPFTFIATVSMISLCGATPVLVDVQPDTYNIDPEKIEEKITDKTKAIIAVDLFGQCADYKALKSIAKKHDLKIIADAAQSFGAKQNNLPVGTFGDITTTSFYPAKPLGAYGEGGACFTEDDTLAKKMRRVFNHGQDEKYDHACIGINARLDSLQAAILLSKLTIYEKELERRQVIANKYDEALQNNITTPTIKPENQSSYAMYTVLAENRDDLRKYLSAQGIPTAVHYPVPVHLQPAFKNLGYKVGDFPVSERIAKHVVSLPMHPYLTDEQINKVATAVKQFATEMVTE